MPAINIDTAVSDRDSVPVTASPGDLAAVAGSWEVSRADSDCGTDSVEP